MIVLPNDLCNELKNGTLEFNFTCNGFSPGESFVTYLEGKNPDRPKHLPFHQCGSDESIRVTLLPAFRSNSS